MTSLQPRNVLAETTLLSRVTASYLAGMPARRRTATTRVAPAQPGLRLHAEGERYSTLLKERERLLRSINTKKTKLERALIESQAAQAEALGRLQPYLERFEAATAQLRSLFEQLLAPGRLSPSAAKQVGKVRETLAGFGYLGMPDENEDEPEDFEDWDNPQSGEGTAYSPRDPRDPRDSDGAHEQHAKREVASAQQRGQGKDQESLRATFRRLVAASHPDRATDEADRELRTATIKQATQAYQAGDLARLLELEKAWRRGQSLPPADGAEASCRELERVIVELCAQASQLQRELRAAQASRSRSSIDESILQALEEAQSDVEKLETLRDFVTRFRDGKMSLAEFVRGPRPDHSDEEEAIAAAVAEILAAHGPKPKPSPKRARAKPKPHAKAKQP